MDFSITAGNPSEEEALALKVALESHKVEILKPIIKRSVFGLPQLREPLPHQITFGARRESK
jgi:uncharacterized protein YukJ